MENSEFLEGSRVGDGSIQPSSTFKGSENPGDEILVDLDSYFEDVNDILMISRMVSNSVIKGIVNAVTEETAEEIALKELEMASLKERLQFYVLGGVHGVENFRGSRFSDTVIEKGCMEECVSNLKIAEEKEFRKLEKEIEEIKESEKWVWGLDRTLDTVKNIRETFYERVDYMVYLSKTSFCEWQQEQEFQDELENMVIQNFVRGLQEEFEAKLWEQRTHFHCSKNINQMKNMNELSCLRQELNAISRSLSSPEMGQLPPHGSHDELANTTTPEIIQDSSQLRHMPKDELIKYFKDEMTKMKRNHESRVQEITEEYFTFKREFLKERGGPSRKDKESEVLRKRISEIILKVDDILTENVDLPMAYEVNTENQSTLDDRVESLLSENRHLKDLLTDKRKEVKFLSSQVTDAVEKISNHSLVEANLLNQIRKLKCEVKCFSSQVTDAVEKISNHSLVEANLLNQIWKLKCDIEDMNIEVSVREDIYKSMLKDWIGEIKSDIEYSNMEFITMLENCEINFREAVENCKNTAKWDIEDSDLELIIMREMCGVIFIEAVKGAEGTINFMQMKYDEESKRRVSLEEELLLEREKTLSLEIGEKERLKKEKILFSVLMDEKENLALEARHTLMKERERYDLLNKECSELREQTSQQERLISENSRELNLLNKKLEDMLVKMYSYEKEIKKLNQEIQSAMEDLKVANEEKRMLHNNIEEKEKTITLIEANEMEYKKQIEFIVGSIEGIYKEAAAYECRALETVEKNSLRLEKLKFQCNQLVGKATLFRRMELVYKQRLEKRYSDLEKAEAEVDLLGDEVDALLSLLEKIYIALDHYSPILQHYPGVVEILKLVRRELSGETAKSV